LLETARNPGIDRLYHLNRLVPVAQEESLQLRNCEKLFLDLVREQTRELVDLPLPLQARLIRLGVGGICCTCLSLGGPGSRKVKVLERRDDLLGVGVGELEPDVASA